MQMSASGPSLGPSPSLNTSSPPPDLTPYIVKLKNQYSAGGSYGDVYKCQYYNGQALMEVAVKAFRFCFAADGESGGKKRKMIHRELGIWKRLEHKNIVPFLGVAYGFGMDGAMSLVSLWMPNQSLHGFLMKHDMKLGLGHRLQILVDVAKGLHYLHSFSPAIVHGDLNSNNILIDADYTARLADFGHASFVGNIPEALAYLQRSAARPGALRWSAPEQVEAETFHPTVKSDVYSFGCVALQVLSGKQPWSEIREDSAVVFRLAKGCKPGRPDSRPIDDAYWSLIRACWSPLAERPATESIVSKVRLFLTNCPSFPQLCDVFTSTSTRVAAPIEQSMYHHSQQNFQHVSTHQHSSNQQSISGPSRTQPAAIAGDHSRDLVLSESVNPTRGQLDHYLDQVEARGNNPTSILHSSTPHQTAFRPHRPPNLSYRPREAVSPTFTRSVDEDPISTEFTATQAPQPPNEDSGSQIVARLKAPFEYVRRQFRRRRSSAFRPRAPDIATGSSTQLGPLSPDVTHRPSYDVTRFPSVPAEDRYRDHDHDRDRRVPNSTRHPPPGRSGTFLPAPTHPAPAPTPAAGVDLFSNGYARTRPQNPPNSFRVGTAGGSTSGVAGARTMGGAETYETAPLPPSVTHPAPPPPPQASHRRHREQRRDRDEDEEWVYIGNGRGRWPARQPDRRRDSGT